MKAGDGGLCPSFRRTYEVFGLSISENMTDTMCVSTPHAPAMQTVFNATGQHYRQTTYFIYSGSTATETPNLSAEIGRWIRAGWMSFRRYKRELYDRPKARQVKSGVTSLLHLKARMVTRPYSPIRMRDVDSS